MAFHISGVSTVLASLLSLYLPLVTHPRIISTGSYKIVCQGTRLIDSNFASDPKEFSYRRPSNAIKSNFHRENIISSGTSAEGRRAPGKCGTNVEGRAGQQIDVAFKIVVVLVWSVGEDADVVVV